MNLKTGFKELDSKIGGLKAKELIALASRSGMGKSTFAINIINNIAKQTKDKILYFNFETSKERLKEKIISDNVEIIDTPNITVEEIKKKCEETNDLVFVLIDYLQLIKSSSFFVNDLDNIEHISKTLKTLSKKLDIPILGISELSKQLVERENQMQFHLMLNQSNPLLEMADKIIFFLEDEVFEDNEAMNQNNSDFIKEVKRLSDKIIVAIV